MHMPSTNGVAVHPPLPNVMPPATLVVPPEKPALAKMDKLVIEGRRPLRGVLPVSGSKNTALPLMAAALLAEGTTTLDNIPDLRDIETGTSEDCNENGIPDECDVAGTRFQVGVSRLRVARFPQRVRAGGPPFASWPSIRQAIAYGQLNGADSACETRIS